MTLYEIDANIKAIIENGFSVDEDGVITFEQDDLDALQEKLETKLENIALYIKNTEAEAEAIKAEENALKQRREAKENKVDRLKKYMLGYIEQNGWKKFETAKVLAKVTKGESVEVDMDKLPEQYMTIKTELKPDKKLIKEALKNGTKVEGAELVQSRNIKIS